MFNNAIDLSPVIILLKHDDPNVRDATINMLSTIDSFAKLAESAESDLEDVQNGLHDQIKYERKARCKALDQIESLEEKIKLLKDQNKELFDSELDMSSRLIDIQIQSQMAGKTIADLQDENQQLRELLAFEKEKNRPCPKAPKPIRTKVMRPNDDDKSPSIQRLDDLNEKLVFLLNPKKPNHKHE